MAAIELITMAEMERRKSGTYFIPDKALIALTAKQALDLDAAISDLMEENQDLMMYQYRDPIRGGTVIKWRQSSQIN